jgi:uncharacterized protein
MPERSARSLITRDAHRPVSEVRDGMRIDWDVPLEMDDGVVLRADVFRPAAAGRYPVILGLTPYGKWLSFDGPVWGGQWAMLSAHCPQILRESSNRYQNYEMVDPERFVPEGYACVRVDARGTGRSPGYMDLLSRRETRDYAAAIEWAADQAWSSGRVGLCGVSYLGMNQWQVAALRPRGLAAMCAWEGCSDFYREFSYHGGILSQFGDLWWQKYILTVQYGLGERGIRSGMNGQWVSGPRTLDDAALRAQRHDWPSEVRASPLATARFWRSRLPDFSRIRTPLLSAANWGGQGLHLRGNVEGFLAAGSAQKWLEFHCLEHWTEFYTDHGVGLQKRFFGHFLKGEDNGFDREPRVMIQVRRPFAEPVRASAPEWPLPQTRWRALYLNPARCALEPRPRAAAGRLSFEAASDGVTFLSEPLARTTRLIGPAAARLQVASSSEDADLFLVLRLFSPDLKEVTYSGANDPHTPLAHGWLRASHRRLDRARSKPWRPWHSHEVKEPLVPGRVYALDIEIWPTCIEAPAGYRLGLSVRGRDYQYPGDLTGVPGRIGQPAQGVGPFRHDDPADRPAAVSENRITLVSSAARPSWLRLPFIELEATR